LAIVINPKHFFFLPLLFLSAQYGVSIDSYTYISAGASNPNDVIPAIQSAINSNVRVFIIISVITPLLTVLSAADTLGALSPGFVWLFWVAAAPATNPLVQKAQLIVPGSPSINVTNPVSFCNKNKLGVFFLLCFTFFLCY
jgi:hypothetical protein